MRLRIQGPLATTWRVNSSRRTYWGGWQSTGSKTLWRQRPDAIWVRISFFSPNIKGTPSKRQVSKRLKRQAYKTSALQNIRFTKCQVYKMSGLQNVRFTKCQVFKTSGCKKHPYKFCRYLWLVEMRRFCCSNVWRQRDGCGLFSILEGFLPYISIISISNLKTVRFETRRFENWLFDNLTFCKPDFL